jgi:hypothetical protein
MSSSTAYPSARSLIERLVNEGFDSEAIERRLLMQQNRLHWDVPVSNPFAFEGIKKESDRIRLLVWLYVKRLGSAARGDQVGVEPFASSFEDDDLWFSGDSPNVSLRSKILSPSRLREQPFDQTWASLERMAYKIAWNLVHREYHLDAGCDLDDLVQAGRIAAWRCLSTYDGRTGKYSTYAHQAMFNAMKDYSDSINAFSTLATFSEATGCTPDFSDTICDAISIWLALKSTKDAHLIVAQVVGLRDDETDEPNVRVRRHRARQALAAKLNL